MIKKEYTTENTLTLTYDYDKSGEIIPPIDIDYGFLETNKDLLICKEAAKKAIEVLKEFEVDKIGSISEQGYNSASICIFYKIRQQDIQSVSFYFPDNMIEKNSMINAINKFLCLSQK